MLNADVVSNIKALTEKHLNDLRTSLKSSGFEEFVVEEEPIDGYQHYMLFHPECVVVLLDDPERHGNGLPALSVQYHYPRTMKRGAKFVDWRETWKTVVACLDLSAPCFSDPEYQKQVPITMQLIERLKAA